MYYGCSYLIVVLSIAGGLSAVVATFYYFGWLFGLLALVVSIPVVPMLISTGWFMLAVITAPFAKREYERERMRGNEDDSKP